MSDYYALVEERRKIREQLAIKRQEAIASIKQTMADLEITLQDLAGDVPLYRSRLPVKYRDAAGNTWTGVGRQPLWIKRLLAHGIDLNLYRVTE